MYGAKMGTKRPAEEAEQVRLRPRRETAKKAKLSPVEEANSSEPSSCSVSEHSALQSSPPASEHTRESSLSSLHVTSHEDGSEASVSSSTSSETSESESDEDIVTIGGPKKPTISSSLFSDDAAEDIRSRLRTLLPQMAQANDLLTSEGPVQNMEDVEDDEQHIEMNLGLGVLEEQPENDTSNSSDGSSDAGEEPEDREDLPASSCAAQRAKDGKASDVMSKLMGQRADQRKVGIEDLG